MQEAKLRRSCGLSALISWGWDIGKALLFDDMSRGRAGVW